MFARIRCAMTRRFYALVQKRRAPKAGLRSIGRRLEDIPIC